MQAILNELIKRLMSCIKLSVTEDKIEPIRTLIERHAAELLELIKDSKDVGFIKSKFSNFINKTLSTIEAIDLGDTKYKAVRKLVLSEIHGCLDMIVNNLEKKNE
jgi:hypothetical protein